jgi:hypothetical protein
MIGDIPGQSQRVTAGAGDERRGLGDLIGGSRQHGDLGARRGQGSRGGPADAPAGSGHEGYLPAKLYTQIHNNG